MHLTQVRPAGDVDYQDKIRTLIHKPIVD